MTPDEIKAVRRAAGLSQKDLAAALSVDVALVRNWEKGEQFPTRAHCIAMAALPASAPPKGKKAVERTPMELLGDPGFFTLLRKLLAHAPLRTAVEALAADYVDPNETSERRDGNTVPDKDTPRST